MRGLTCAVLATFVGGLLSCSDHSDASQPSFYRRPQASQERIERVRWPQQAYGSVSAPQRAWRRDPDPQDDEPALARAWAREYDEEAISWEQQSQSGEMEPRHRHISKYRGSSEKRYHPQETQLEDDEEEEEEEDDVATAGSHVIPDKLSKLSKKHGGGGYGIKRHHYSTEGSLQLAPKQISVVCSVKDPLEHIIWLRTPCPEEYERGEVIARGSVSLVPDVFGVSVSGEDGGFTSTLTILKPRDIVGGGVFRCEAWPHFTEHRRHRSLGNDTDIQSELEEEEEEEEPNTGNHTRTRRQTRVKRSPHDPWNAIILGGTEMIEECFYGSYGDKWRKYRALNTARTADGTENNIETQEKLKSDASNQQTYQNYQPIHQSSAQNYPQYEKVNILPSNFKQAPQPELTSQTSYQPYPTQATYPSTAYQSGFGKFAQDPSSYQIQAPQPSSQSYYQSQPSQTYHQSEPTHQNYQPGTSHIHQSQPSSQQYYHSDPSQFYHQSPPSPTTTEKSATQTYQTSSKPTLTLSQLKQLYSFYTEIQKTKKLQAMQNAEERNDPVDYNKGGLDIRTNMRHRSEDNQHNSWPSSTDVNSNLRRGAEDANTGDDEHDSSGLHLRTNMRRGSEVNRRAESRVINVIFPHTQK